METLLQNVILPAQRYNKNLLDASILSQLEYRIDALNKSTDEWAASTVFNNILVKENLLLAECCNYFTNFLCLPDCPSSLLSKILSFFNSMAWYNIRVRNYFKFELNLPISLMLCLTQIVDKQVNVGLVVQVVKLYEIVSNRNAYTWTSTSPDFVQFLVRTIYQSSVGNANTELNKHCLGCLSNICSQSSIVRDFVRRLDNFTKLCDILLSLLQHQSTAVVISSLTLIIYLNEKLKDMVLSTKNIPQTFQCTFNVVIKGDNFMTRHHAVDLLSHLLDQNAIRSLLTKYQLLNQTLQTICSLFVTLDPDREQLSNIYNLFLRFCDYEALNLRACSAITQTGPVNPSRLTTPLLAILECSKISSESCTFPDLPIKALKLLKCVLESTVKTNSRIQNYVSSDVLARLIEDCLKSSIETGHLLVLEKCERIVVCLQLASVASVDDEVRTDLLEIITPALCAHLFEFQMVSNPVSLVSSPKLPEWSKYGVKIVTELISLLRLLEPFSSQHKEIYWRYLKDSKIVPFIAYSFVSGDEQLVDQAFSITFRMSQLEGFTSRWLSELIAANVRATTQVRYNAPEHLSQSDMANGNSSQASNSYSVISSSITPSDEKAVDQLIEKIKKEMHISDPKITQFIELYDRKIAAMQIRERHTLALSEAKTAALLQGDLTISQYRSSRPESEQEALKLRTLLLETELKCDQAVGQVEDLKAEFESAQKHNRLLDSHCKQLEMELDSSKDLLSDYLKQLGTLKDSNEVAKREIESEREMHDVLRKHYEKMKQNFETTAQKLLEVEGDLKQTRKQLKETQQSSKELGGQVDKLETLLASKDDETIVLEKNVEALRKTMDVSEKEKKTLAKQISELENELGRKMAIIKDHERSINRMRDELDKHANITQMIHKLTGHPAEK